MARPAGLEPTTHGFEDAPLNYSSQENQRLATLAAILSSNNKRGVVCTDLTGLPLCYARVFKLQF